jgi:hypothetical protein
MIDGVWRRLLVGVLLGGASLVSATGIAAPASTAPPGAPPLRDGDFAYTAAEAADCENFRQTLVALRRGGQAATNAQDDIQQWRHCVLNVRAFVQRTGPFDRSPQEESSCIEDLNMVRVILSSREPEYDTATMYFNQFKRCVLGYRTNAQAREARKRAGELKRAEEEAAAQKQEQERAEAMALDKKIEAAAQAVIDNPKTSQVVLSILLCRRSQDRAETMAALAKDRKYSRIGGAVNLTRRAELQDDLAATDEALKALRLSLRDIKRPPLSCKIGGVALFASCFADDAEDRDPGCSLPEAQVMMRAAAILQRN